MSAETIGSWRKAGKDSALRLWDWALRVPGNSPWIYHVAPMGGDDAPSFYAIVRRPKKTFQGQEYLTWSGEWVPGEPFHLIEDRQVRTLHSPDRPSPVAYATYEHAERHVRRLEIGVPGRWPVAAALLAIVAVGAAIAEAVASFVC